MPGASVPRARSAKALTAMVIPDRLGAEKSGQGSRAYPAKFPYRVGISAISLSLLSSLSTSSSLPNQWLFEKFHWAPPGQLPDTFSSGQPRRLALKSRRSSRPSGSDVAVTLSTHDRGKCWR